MTTLNNHRWILYFFCAFLSIFIFHGIALAGTPSDIRVTNVRGTQFSVSWVSEADEIGSVRYGTSIEGHASWAPAYDDRGISFSDDVHHVTITGLLPDTTYYYEIISGGTVDDNGGEFYALNPGPALVPQGSCFPVGQLFLSDGITPAEGAIVYVTILGDGADDSATESMLVDDSGYWYLELTNFRTGDYSMLYSYVCGTSNILVEAQAGGDGIAQLITAAVNWVDVNDQRPDMILLAGIITGRVTDLETGNGIPDVSVQAWTEQCGGQSVGVGTDTDIEGFYTIKGLSVGGSCYVRTDHYSDLYIDVWHDGIPVDTCEGATSVIISAEDINFELDKDSDEDGLPDSVENATCTDPNDTDTDDDGIPDGVEDANQNGFVDPGETNPCMSDTDSDGMPDGWETGNDLDPNNPGDASGDSDSDGLNNLGEYQNSTNPAVSDSDADGMPDGWEVQYGLDPLSDDASEDPDEDDYTNLQEYQAGTDPNVSDKEEFPWEIFYPAFIKKK